ncbi:uncharacterized protein LOC110461527 [Mizuhopecten yessoensis]|uniref:Uncharacterized protein n=1 Tax=Mizuhopecten yessoensis TaxID=6573 RepID=A0A210Q056_MIZYE|nr:uncharacterized protein LOC110461527 [Mizuhopecten yessoensis]OWF42130.1 hypothetical protein KP79_PYT09177 [Mizuhopecten yessoensis]
MDISEWIILTSSLITIATASSCVFPVEWRGRWNQDTYGELEITDRQISRKGTCSKKDGDKYLIADRSSSCYRCMVITKRADNILQYKESLCFGGNSIESVCEKINGDATLHTIVRVPSVPVPCPFQGYHEFSYSNSTTTNNHCKWPVSQIHACADDSKFKFIYKHCNGMSETYDRVLDFQCLATWVNGEKYLYGKFTHPYNPDVPQYRCFMHSFYGGNGDMSMTVDGTCQGLQSPSVGFTTMKLQRDFEGTIWPTPQCRFPEFFHRRKHWRDMSGRFVIEVDEGLQIFRVKDKSVTSPDMVVYSEGSYRSDMKMVVRCIDNVDSSHRHEREFMAHVTDDACVSGYRCLRLVKREPKVLELYISTQLGSRHEACSDSSFDNGEKHVLIPAGLEATNCPTDGDFSFIDKTTDCTGRFKIGCTSKTGMVVEKKCPFNRQSVEFMDCLLDFKKDGTHYVIVQRPKDIHKRATCLAFRDTEGGIDVKEDSECGAKRSVVRNSAIHYVLFKPSNECPRVVTYTPTPTEVYRPNDDTGNSGQPDQEIETMDDQGLNKEHSGKIISEDSDKRPVDRSNGVINAENAGVSPRTNVSLIFCVTIVILACLLQR